MAKFDDVAPVAMMRLMEVFDLKGFQAAAVMGNAGHESAGLTKLHEIKPTVKGSRGGYGWFQWTGPRRVAFENYCKRTGFPGTSYDANIGFLIEELKGAEKKTIPALRATRTLDEAVVTFEKSFERSGVPHYDSRKKWAQRAHNAYLTHLAKQTEEKHAVVVPPPPDIPKPNYPVGDIREGRNKDDAVIDLSPKVVITTLTGGGAVGIMSILNGISNVYGLIAFLAIFAVIGFILYRVWFKKRRND